MWCNTHTHTHTPRGTSAAKSAATKPEDVTAEAAGPGSMQPFPNGPANCGMLPPCTHPIARIAIVGLARPSIREPHLRAHRPTTSNYVQRQTVLCKGRLADQAHLINHPLKPARRLRPAPLSCWTPCSTLSHGQPRRRHDYSGSVSIDPPGGGAHDSARTRSPYVALTSEGFGSRTRRRRLPHMLTPRLPTEDSF